MVSILNHCLVQILKFMCEFGCTFPINLHALALKLEADRTAGCAGVTKTVSPPMHARPPRNGRLARAETGTGSVMTESMNLSIDLTPVRNAILTY